MAYTKSLEHFKSHISVQNAISSIINWMITLIIHINWNDQKELLVEKIWSIKIRWKVKYDHVFNSIVQRN